MRIALVIVAVVVVVAFVSGAALMAGIVFFGLPTGRGQVVQPPGTGPQVAQTTPTPMPGVTPPVTPRPTPQPGTGPQVPQTAPIPKPGITPIATPGPTPQPVDAKATPSVTPQGTPVDFELLVMQTESPQSSVLLNVTLQAKLNASPTNSSDSDAHNVRVQLRARVGNSYIKINGADPFVVNIGDLAARTATSQNLTLEMKMSLAQGRQAQNEGMVFEIAVLSNERNKQFPNMRCTQTGCTST